MCKSTALARALHQLAIMRMLVTCPESAHLEQIEYEDDPAGMLIVRCSAWDCTGTCPRTCAARFDLRRRVLVVRSLLNSRS